MRKEAPDFNASQVDGMYYFALRNYGVDLIQKQGDLEGGIYQLTLAERFAPLDKTADGLREGARAYIQAASYFGVNWGRAVELFRNVAGGMARDVGWQHERQPAFPTRADARTATSFGRKAKPAQPRINMRRRRGSETWTPRRPRTRIRPIRRATRRPRAANRGAATGTDDRSAD